MIIIFLLVVGESEAAIRISSFVWPYLDVESPGPGRPLGLVT